MPEDLSQREKNHRETWAAIHMAAFTAAVREGRPEVPVEEIASEAGVSRRTFFNYFACKEDAILGARSPQLTDGIADDYARSDADELTRVVHLFVAVMRTTLPANGIARRREALETLPSLRARLGSLINAVEGLVREVLLRHREPDEELDVLLLLAMAIVRHAAARHHGEDAELEPLLSHSIRTFRSVVDGTR